MIEQDLPRWPVRWIARAVAEEWGVPEAVLCGNERGNDAIWRARQAVYLLAMRGGRGSHTIGRALHRHGATVRHGALVGRWRMEHQADYRRRLEATIARLERKIIDITETRPCGI